MATKAWKDLNHDKMCAYRRKWYRNNSNSVIQRSKNRRLFLLNWLREIKRKSRCALCPEKVWCCLDFHHIGKKFDNLCRIVYDSCSIERLRHELLKCVVVCSNCHRKGHFGKHASRWQRLESDKINIQLIKSAFAEACKTGKKNGYVPQFALRSWM